MIDFENYTLNPNELKLIRFDFNFKTSDAYDVIYESINKDEKNNISNITYKFPNTSSMVDDELYWDIILVDTEVLFYLENILVKYGVVYTITEICDLYYKKSKKIKNEFILKIDEYIENLFDVDNILDRINEIGIDKINKFELSYLEKQSKK